MWIKSSSTATITTAGKKTNSRQNWKGRQTNFSRWCYANGAKAWWNSRWNRKRKRSSTIHWHQRSASSWSAKPSALFFANRCVKFLQLSTLIRWNRHPHRRMGDTMSPRVLLSSRIAGPLTSEAMAGGGPLFHRLKERKPHRRKSERTPSNSEERR